MFILPSFIVTTPLCLIIIINGIIKRKIDPLVIASIVFEIVFGLLSLIICYGLAKTPEFIPNQDFLGILIFLSITIYLQYTLIRAWMANDDFENVMSWCVIACIIASNASNHIIFDDPYLFSDLRQW